MKHFTQITNALLRNPKIKNGPFRLLSVLLSYKYNNNDVFVSQGTVAKDLGVNLRTITNWLNNLKKLKLVSWRKRNGRSNIYDFNIEKIFLGEENKKETNCVPVMKNNVVNYGKNFPTNNTKNNNFNKNTDYLSSDGYKSCLTKVNELKGSKNQIVDFIGK